MSNESIMYLLLIIPTYFLVHLMVYNIQFISSKQYFYGVYIKNVNLYEKDKKRIDKGYKKRINIIFLLAMLLFISSELLFNNSAIVTTITITVYMVMSYFILRKYYIEVKFLKEEYLSNKIEEKEALKVEKRKIAIDTQFLNEKAKVKSKFKKLFSICILLSLASVVYLIINYNNLPDMIPHHWGINGKADAFAPKTIKNVFMISFIDISLVLLMAFMTIETIGVRIYLDTKDLEKNRKKAIRCLNGIGYSFFFLTLSIQLMTSTMPIFMVNKNDIPMIMLIPSLIVPFVICIPMIYYYMGLSSIKSKEKYSNASDSDDEKWLYGILYYNENDPSLMVEKRLGMGWTINMANPKGKLILVLILAMLFGSIVLPFI